MLGKTPLETDGVDLELCFVRPGNLADPLGTSAVQAAPISSFHVVSQMNESGMNERALLL